MDPDFELSKEEIAGAQILKRSAPFRDWHIVKPKGQPAINVDSKAKATRMAKKMSPAAIYKVG